MERESIYGSVLDQQRHVEITRHAMHRLQERVKNFNGYRNWQDMVRTARYSGKTESNMTYEEQQWCQKNIRNLYPSSQIRLLNGFAFIFMGNKGHARTLVTVISMDQTKRKEVFAE